MGIALEYTPPPPRKPKTDKSVPHQKKGILKEQPSASELAPASSVQQFLGSK